jgi:hypothetical protein
MRPSSTIVAVAGILLFAQPFASAREKRMKRSDLPPAVEQSVVENSQGASIRGFSREKENGRTLYEAELIVHGHSKDILMDKTGAVVEIEEQVAAEALPPPVRAELQAKAGKGKLLKVESLTKKGKLVAYEAQVLTRGKKSEVQVSPDGRPLDHKE